ncbi:putative SNF2 family helicase [Aspergillus tanneri]|uniref:Helicase C-terminal domain-containing protein n=1 Tax=Aspergillus tanneri TaxID=1220188 RepID=A0A5M9MU76_9EURO|nr:uncharacterized protein ATNIH1004_003134 [Aspergillus tanneri]KAA8650448.1 hypothetical protein ATNIH1004_003134 [Aspergillus tanneri]
MTTPAVSTRPPKKSRRGPRPILSPNGPESSSALHKALDNLHDPDDIPELVKSRPYSGPKTLRTQLALGLPPMYKLSDIYHSITSRALELGLDDVLSHLGSRQLRVVTVCSGTESPLLALEMVQENLRKHFGKNFEFRHLFSAEIVPFKQAYIERNFHPRFIFRDVGELKDRVAQTAYGSLEKIPKNVDLLVAGFSCVDFSGLNNRRKTLDEKGESGGTFWGIIRYAKTYRPRIVILENVKTAPWEKIGQHWNEIDYFAVHIDVDTKAYYLPQTRERGYMFCIDQKLIEGHGLSKDDLLEWKNLVVNFKRPASSPAGMFLLNADDPRLEQIEKDMAVRIAASSTRATIDWSRYQDNGTCQMLDFAWHTWIKSMPERVLDTIDVNFLRKLLEGYDMNYKERYIELSQGLDRELDNRAYGIVGCITPCGLPYITTRGGPLCGIESLALQGLPLDRLLLTRESQRELQDLAGNAMSSTVVGVAILSALIVGYKVFKKEERASTVKSDRHRFQSVIPQDDYNLVPSNIQVGQFVDLDIRDFGEQAARSARTNSSLPCPPAVWDQFLQAVTRTIGDELRFLDIKRSEVWTASYEGKHSVLNLVIEPPDKVNWLFFAKASDRDPAVCANREILSKPIARMTPIPGCLLQASAYLHKREADKHGPVVYLFLDPSKLGEPRNDSFVFSLEHRRNPGYAPRLTIAEVSHKWRSGTVQSEPRYVNVYYRKWIGIQTATLRPYVPKDPITCYNLEPGSTVSITHADCHNANITLLSFAAPADTFGSIQNKGPWEVSDPLDSQSWLRDYSWLLQKACKISGFEDWNIVVEGQALKVVGCSACTTCVPPKPRLLWGRDGRGWLKAYEDPHDAALYERQYKARPPPFLIFRRIDEHGFGSLRITLNIQSLLHQAYSKLIGPSTTGNVSFHWRLIPNAYDSRNLVFPKFDLDSNRSDSQSSQPPSFLLKLRPEQLRSLSWMIVQESDDIEPFVEEETEEALLSQLMWRAEAKVSVQKCVRGGVLADDVGYGKTAIVLGLIDAQFERGNASAPEPTRGFIPTKSTLIVVPHIMLPQWQSEITKFLGSKYKVLVFSTAMAFTKKTIRDIRNSDIILVSWNIFNNAGYYQKLQRLTGMPRVPTKPGRNFDDWFSEAQASLKEQVEILVNQGPDAFLESLRAKRQKVKDEQANYTYVPSKRLRGKRYAEAKMHEEPSTETGLPYADISSADEKSDSSDWEDPDTLRSKVSRLLKLQPMKSFAQGSVGVNSEEEATEYEDSVNSNAKCKGTKRQPGRLIVGKRKAKTWDDRKEFNISRDEKNQDWEIVKTPLLHMFSFDRLVIDEFTYANTERLGPLLVLQARSKWVLSGTPPLNDFADVKSIAPFLGIHLGVDDDDLHSQNKRLKALWKHRSDAEAFQAFRAPRSEAWHRHRHELAQIFLSRFARRNIADIDEIPFTEHIILVSQSPAERAIYLELYKQLMTYNRQMRRGRRKFSSDQVERLDEIIGSSRTPEEALLKRCASLALHGRWDSGKPEATTCKSLIETRRAQITALVDEFLMKTKLAAWLYGERDIRHDNFHKFVESVLRHDFGDETVTTKAYAFLKYAVLNPKDDDWKFFFADPDHTPLRKESEIEAVTESMAEDQEVDDSVSYFSGLEKEAESSEANEDIGQDDGCSAKRGDSMRQGMQKTRKSKTDKDGMPALPNKPTSIDELKVLLQKATTDIRNYIVEWVMRTRALRFLEAMHLAQTGSDIECSKCQGKLRTTHGINILGSCGHTLCIKCVPGVLKKEECIVEGCRGSGKKFNIINGSTLGRYENDSSAKYGGSKMDKLIQIIQSVPTDERVLLFIQFPELVEVACMALDLARIKYTAISTTGRKSAHKIEEYQKNGLGESRVLILNLGSEMAAGLNLQCANHVIFLSPMLAETQYDYDSTMTQAIGRSRRYGQTKHVHIYHLLAKMTIDVNLFQERRESVLIERNGEPILVSRDFDFDSESISCQGPSLMMDNVV